MDAFISTIQSYASSTTLLWLAFASVVMFIGTLIAIPVILVRLPADYFDDREAHTWLGERHPLLRLLAHVAKNAVGVVFLLAGLAMLFLPGQGVLTILIGISLMDFPGKRALERKIVGQPSVLSTINKMRGKFGSPPLVIKDP